MSFFILIKHEWQLFQINLIKWDKVIQKSRSVVGYPLDAVREMGDRRLSWHKNRSLSPTHSIDLNPSKSPTFPVISSEGAYYGSKGCLLNVINSLLDNAVLRIHQMKPGLILWSSVNRMVEPSPPARHVLSGADAIMADVGVKVEREDGGGLGGVCTNSDPPKTSPLHDWPGNQPLEARQLTPPLSRSPSVRMLMEGMMKCF